MHCKHVTKGYETKAKTLIVKHFFTVMPIIYIYWSKLKSKLRVMFVIKSGWTALTMHLGMSRPKIQKAITLGFLL